MGQLHRLVGRTLGGPDLTFERRQSVCARSGLPSRLRVQEPGEWFVWPQAQFQYIQATGEGAHKTVVEIDIDNDADNDGEIDADDDPIEMDAPGRYINVNDDDDNGNSIPDLEEAGPISGEDDLEPFTMPGPPFDPLLVGSYLTLGPLDLNAPSVWESADKTGEIEFEEIFNGETSLGIMHVWVIGVDPIPTTLYLEGRVQGTVRLKLQLWDENWSQHDEDEIMFTVQARPNILTIFHGQDGPEVDDALDEVVGAFTVANRNDTDGDGWYDYMEEDYFASKGFGGPQGEDEVDLMRLRVNRPAGYTLGTPIKISFTAGSTAMRLWGEPTREHVHLDGPELNPELPPTFEFAFTEDFDHEFTDFFVELINPSSAIAANYKIKATIGGIDGNRIRDGRVGVADGREVGYTECSRGVGCGALVVDTSRVFHS